ncbi:MAG TPA: hypothetical protein VFX59_20225 [Polyangiales bacterium]|nr:hypothetical protein [Polyangiales bacterium]
MDELPNDLRAMLDLARDEFDPPDDGAQQRVRFALAAAIGAPAAGAALSGGKAAALNSQAPAALAAKTGWVALGGKLAAVGAIAAAGIGFAVYGTRAPLPAVSVPAPVVAPALVEPVIEPSVAVVPVEEPLAVEEKLAPAQEAKPRKIVPAADTLSEEMALLRSASEALGRGDEEAALVQLHTHAKRFPRGSLREERDGLRAIAECTRDQSPSQDAAQRFARQYPSSVLAARVATACRAR